MFDENSNFRNGSTSSPVCHITSCSISKHVRYKGNGSLSVVSNILKWISNITDPPRTRVIGFVNYLGVAVNQRFFRIWLDSIFLDKTYIKQYNWITLQYMYSILTSPHKKYILFQYHMYVYFTSKKYKRFGFKNRNYFIKLHIRQSRKFHWNSLFIHG